MKKMNGLWALGSVVLFFGWWDTAHILGLHETYIYIPAKP
jgi:hypothetical protein